MGCDIHAYREKQVNGQWVTADEWDTEDPEDIHVPYQKRAYRGRDYELFGLLADGVRSSHTFSFKARGLPNDVSPEVKANAEAWGVDGHNHSYIYLNELKALIENLKNFSVNFEGMMHTEQLAKLNESISAGSPNWDLLYPCCSWTNQKDFENFKFSVPALFMVGVGLQTLVDSFEGVDGDNHRLVFFFDN